MKSALFLLSGILLNRYGSVDEVELHGRAREPGSRLCGVLFVLSGLALAGLPPFGTGLGKAVLEDSAEVSGYSWLVALFVLVSAVTGGAVVRAGLGVYFGLGRRHEDTSGPQMGGSDEERETSRLETLPPTMLAPIGFLLALGLVSGVVPVFAEGVSRAAATFTDHAGYLSQALQLAPFRHPATSEAVGWTASGVLWGLLSRPCWPS